jgi:hypothetical protein
MSKVREAVEEACASNMGVAPSIPMKISVLANTYSP